MGNVESEFEKKRSGDILPLQVLLFQKKAIATEAEERRIFASGIAKDGGRGAWEDTFSRSTFPGKLYFFAGNATFLAPAGESMITFEGKELNSWPKVPLFRN